MKTKCVIYRPPSPLQIGARDLGTAETEVNFRLPRASDPGPDLVPKDIPIVPGAVGAEADTPDPGQPRRLGAPRRGQTETVHV